MDVLHYFFEDDLRFFSAEDGEAKDKMRHTLYRELYDVEYKYGVFDKSASRTYKDFDVDSEELSHAESETIDPFNPKERKPFIPATQMSENSALPFGDIIDAPLSH